MSKHATLRIAKDLTLPDEAVTEVIDWLGRRGSGKTYGAGKYVELLHDRGAQFIVIDTVGVWYGLRLAADGTSKGIDIPVLGGLHGDIPLEPTAGALIADLVVDRQLSVVLDVSQWEEDTDRARFAYAFGKRFFYRKRSHPSAVHVVLEECQEIVPQNPQREEARMLGMWTKIAKLGRNFGIGLSLLSQRPQEVNKKVLNLAEILFAFQLVGTHERRAVEEWIKSKAIDEHIGAELPKLEVGHPHVWSPALLKISKVVSIEKKWTFDASRTPKLGEKAREVKPLAPIDLSKLQKDMAATIEKAKADDPAALRKQIAELQRELAKKPQAAPPSKPVRDEAAITRAVADVEKVWSRRLADARADIDVATKHLGALIQQAEHAKSVLETASSNAKEAKPVPPHISTALATSRHAPVPEFNAVNYLSKEVARQLPKKIEREILGTSTNGELTPSDRKILDALALMETLGTPSTRAALGFFAGYAQAGRFNNLVGGLNTRGFVHYPADAMVALTDQGRAHANPDASPIRSVRDLHELWMTKLEPSQWRILAMLLDCYPAAIPREELARGTNYEVAGRFNNLVGSLRTLGAVDYPTKGTVRASDVLFPKGLA